MTEKKIKIGIDAGSTTLKIIVLDQNDNIIYKSYRRHKADVNSVFINELEKINLQISITNFQLTITGSAGMGIAERCGVPFVQEVVAAVELVQKRFPHCRTLFDLGGEDAKMVFFGENRHPDIRMNGSCAGGTGAFIDQMASLLNIPVENFGEQAEHYEKIYPVASRCGVFAKTDIQNLIARNISVPDIAASTLYAVALQSVTTLARGCDIVPPVLCIGGPLTFIPALRRQFCEILKLKNEELLLLENSEFFPAFGAALMAESQIFTIKEIIEKCKNSDKALNDNVLSPLFNNKKEYEEWKKNRDIKPFCFKSLENVNTQSLYLGIDSGSTTTKIVIIDDAQNIVYQYYTNNEGNSLKKVSEGLAEFFNQTKEQNIEAKIVSSAVTGYGEELIKQAFNLDFGIVETMAHLAGAKFINPDVSFILDIGGQDMKSIFVRNGVISNIELNEACSSGCGSFLQNFASTMNLTLAEFTQKACLAKNPADLGTRCTVFMNSKVKQSLRENAGIDDIAGGLAYSVVKNCLFKVLKISNINALGENIVVQGGTFRNDAVYRALELLSGKKVSATDYPELMGAFGAAIYAFSNNKEQKTEHKNNFDVPKYTNKELNCKGCTNQCSIVRFDFENGNVCYAGNKCEKIFFSKNSAKEKGYNFFDKKNEIIFKINDLLTKNKTKIGIPRALNLYENFPFWKTLFENCGFEVKLSPESTFKLYQSGVGSVMSDNICFPAKLAHGHILSLAEQGVSRIFYPLVPKEEQEFCSSSNSYNCPIVSGYPDVIRSAINPEKFGIAYDTPVISFHNNENLKRSCWKYFENLFVDKKIFEQAFATALQEKNETLRQLIDYQQNLLQKAINDNSLIFVVAGRPYHADALINQKTGQILADLGVITLTDDVFRASNFSEAGEWKNLNIVSQWSYPNRVIQTALQVSKLPQNVQMIQLNSFGCGPDSFLMDETAAILKHAGKNLTIIRIDEIASAGSVRLRLRSLVESLK